MEGNKRETRLTIKQENFCRFYVDTGNASEAYRMAYNCENMKVESINRCAFELSKDLKITSRVDEIKKERAEASKVSRQKVESVLMDIVGHDPRDIYMKDPKTDRTRMKNPTQMSKASRNALKKITNNHGNVSYEFNGKVEAARLLGQWNGWDAPTEVNVKNESDGILTIGLLDKD